jgi:cytoskeletal protein RodZ
MVDMELVRTLVRRRIFVTLPMTLVAILLVGSTVPSAPDLSTAPAGSSHRSDIALQPIDDSGSSADSTSDSDDNTSTGTPEADPDESSALTPDPSQTPTAPASTTVPSPSYTCACRYRTDSLSDGANLCSSQCSTPSPCGRCGGPGLRPDQLCMQACLD